MRKNLPVTDREYVLADDVAIITRTDLKGKITYANAAFMKISGFSRDEVIGAPQNLVRHPDMPCEAFADMWKTIKSGKPWTGMVKNRCKNGDFYWVLANVSPIVESGTCTGYMSVRIKPSRAEVDAADGLYRLVAAGNAGNLRIREGRAIRVGMAGWIRTCAELPFGLRLWASMGGCAALFVLAAVLSMIKPDGGVNLQFNALLALCGLGAATALSMGWYLASSIGGPLARARAAGEAIVSGDLARKIEIAGDPAVADFMRTVNQMNGKLLGILLDVRASAESVRGAAEEIASGNTDLSQRTEEQASSLEETASSMEELTSTVKQNAENAKQANQLAMGASTIAVKGGQVVSDVVGTMASINTSSKKIVEIISVIDGIAFQTNILALNAAVEAARAGEQGRGFAVVATEVRNLAQRSAAAAKEIKTLIGDSVEKVESGAKLVDHAGETMKEIIGSVKRVTDIMSEITAASQEQSSGIEQVNQAITQMDQVTQQNAALVEEAAAASESMQNQAQALAQAVSVFKLAGASLAKTAPVERRGAGRPANVTRLPAKAPRTAPAKRLAPAKVAGGDAQTGEWNEF